jgi:hypothetical protein
LDRERSMDGPFDDVALQRAVCWLYQHHPANQVSSHMPFHPALHSHSSSRAMVPLACRTCNLAADLLHASHLLTMTQLIATTTTGDHGAADSTSWRHLSSAAHAVAAAAARPLAAPPASAPRLPAAPAEAHHQRIRGARLRAIRGASGAPHGAHDGQQGGAHGCTAPVLHLWAICVLPLTASRPCVQAVTAQVCRRQAGSQVHRTDQL